jgi:hypothetical protein
MWDIHGARAQAYLPTEAVAWPAPGSSSRERSKGADHPTCPQSVPLSLLGRGKENKHKLINEVRCCQRRLTKGIVSVSGVCEHNDRDGSTGSGLVDAGDIDGGAVSLRQCISRKWGYRKQSVLTQPRPMGTNTDCS